VLPTPLVTGPPKPGPRDAGHAAAEPSADAGSPEPPRALRDDEELPPDVEVRAPIAGMLLEARMRWLDAPPPRSPEGNADALAKARERAAFDVTIELSALGRLRMKLVSKAFGFPAGTELRAREDRYGNVLIWPGAEAYTTLPPGTLRATLGEHRVDVSPLSEPSVVAAGAGSALGLATQKQKLETSLGRLELEQSSVSALGTAGSLLCRMLVELVGVSPESSACRPEALPLRAEYTWASGARFELEASRLSKRPELGAEGLVVPPLTAAARPGELPGPPFVALMDERELSELHTRALPPPAKPEPGAPKLGLVFQNRAESPLYLIVDGAPVVWLRADAEWLVTGLKSGRYAVHARDFFGVEAGPARVVDLPARFSVGDEAERSGR
jgi:hypothetical protein